MIFQSLPPDGGFPQPLGQGLALLQQGLPLLGGGFQLLEPAFRLRQQTGAVVAAFVFQLLESLFQPLSVPGFIPGGHQLVETAAQSLVLGHRKIGKPYEAGAVKDTLLCPQKHLTAARGGKLRHCKAGFGFIGAEIPQGGAAFGFPLNGDVPPLPVQVDAAGHGNPRPGLVSLLVRQPVFGGFCPGVQPVEHGAEEGAPGGFAPFVGGVEDVQSRLQLQHGVLQLAEGGDHFVNSHGRRTSFPASSFREISAASRALGSVSAACFSRAK